MWEREVREQRRPRAANESTRPWADDDASGRLPCGPWCAVAAAWIVGIVVARSTTYAWGWMVLAALFMLGAVVFARRGHARVAIAVALVSVVGWSAAWTTLRREHRPDTHVTALVESVPVLTRFTGVIDSEPYLRDAHGGPFSAMSWAPPETRFTLRLEAVAHAAGARDDTVAPCRGRLMVRLTQADPRLVEGLRIQATGWLSPIAGPQNPGEFDFRAGAEVRGIDGRLTLVHRDNWHALPAAVGDLAPALRRACHAAAARSLHRGLPVETDAGRGVAALLDAVVLGDRREDLAPWSQAFRLAGLMHLLSISGAHLAILLGLTWLGGRLMFGHPARVGALVLVVLALCLIVVPWRVPIVRASIMAAVVTTGVITGRVSRGLEVLALAAWLILLWEPTDLYSPGFQLSFLCVAALILWTPRVARGLHRPSPLASPRRSWRRLLQGRVATYVAANIVAYVIALPLVAHHFQLITPYAALFSLLAIPLLTLILALAYLKLAIGLLLPTVGGWLAPPLTAAASVMQWGVRHGSELPGATIHLPHAPSAAWTVVAVLAAAWLMHRATRAHWRRAALAVGCCALWLAAGQWVTEARVVDLPDPAPRLRFHALAVGDGACYVVRVAATSGEHVLMYDCGSLAYLDVGRRTVVPALDALGIQRIDTLVLSHADLDHFCGVLDVLEHFPVGRLLAAPQLARSAAALGSDPPSATAHLLAELARRRIGITAVAQGWHGAAGEGRLRVLWPPPTYVGAAANDESLVLQLAVDVPGTGTTRRLLLNGDIQDEAIRLLLDSDVNLTADVTDLPHHGSFVSASPAWLQRVRPHAVVQSCGRARRRRDAWGPVLSAAAVPRYDTATYGMVQWVVAADGSTRWRTFHPSSSGSAVRGSRAHGSTVHGASR